LALEDDSHPENAEGSNDASGLETVLGAAGKLDFTGAFAGDVGLAGACAINGDTLLTRIEKARNVEILWLRMLLFLSVYLAASRRHARRVDPFKVCPVIKG